MFTKTRHVSIFSKKMTRYNRLQQTCNSLFCFFFSSDVSRDSDYKLCNKFLSWLILICCISLLTTALESCRVAPSTYSASSFNHKISWILFRYHCTQRTETWQLCPLFSLLTGFSFNKTTLNRKRWSSKGRFNHVANYYNAKAGGICKLSVVFLTLRR